VVDGEGSIDYRPDLPSPPLQIGDDATTDVSICLRVVAVEPDRFELQAWTWQGTQIAAIDRVGLRKRPQLLRVRVDGVVEHQDVWRPEPPMFEEPADAYVKAEAAGPMLEPEEEWRARGRQVIVEREGDDRDLLRAVAESKDHFVVHRPDPEAPDIEALEEDWRAGQLHGIVLELEAALGPESEPLLQWADSHGVLVYLEPASWGAVAPAAEQLQGLDSPLLIVDPLLSARAQGQAEVETSEEAIASALDSVPGLHLVLAGTTAAAAGSLPQRYPNRILMGDPSSSPWQEIDGGRLAPEATENLRYLTELTTLMWFRGVSGRTGSELGRYDPVVATS
jgi:hypothetical protein